MSGILQPAPAEDPWRKMPGHTVTLRLSRTSLGAQNRYSGGIKDCLEIFFPWESIDLSYIILAGGRVTSPNYRYIYEICGISSGAGSTNSAPPGCALISASTDSTGSAIITNIPAV